MARRTTHPGDDWMDALKAAMRIDPELRKQREDREERDRRESQHRPTLASAVATAEVVVEREAEEAAASKPAATHPDPPDPAQLPPAEFPWQKPDDESPPPPAPLQVNFRPSAPSEEAADVRPPMPVFGKRPGPSAAAQRLWAAAEPLLLFVCRLNRMKRTGVLSDKFRPESLRVEISSLLDNVSDSGDPGTELTQPLRAFIDVIVTKAGFPFGRRWPSLTQSTLPAEQVFQAAASTALTDESRRLDGTWAVYHACLCLSADLLPATDSLRSGVELLEELDANLFTKTTDRADRVCPQAYGGVYDQPLLPSVGKKLRAVAVASVGVLLLAIAVAVGLNVLYLKKTGEAIGTVKQTLVRPDEDKNPMTKSQNAVKTQIPMTKSQ